MEENIEGKFEKKSSKKVAITILIILALLIVTAVAGILYLNYTRRPEHVFSQSIENVFEPLEKDTNERKAKLDLELSMEIESKDLEIAMANEMLKSLKLKSITEVDLDKKIFNETLQASIAGQEIISADALIQNEKMYFYLNEIYSKYIEIPEEYFGGEDLSTIFEINNEVPEEEVIKDIKQILIDEVSAKEFTKENVELNGEKVQKTTLKLTPKEVLEITVKVLEVYNGYMESEETTEVIEDLKEEIKYAEATENYMNISLYTKGLKNNIVKAELIMVNMEAKQVVCIEINKKAESETSIKFLMNENDVKISGVHEMFEIIIKEDGENQGTVELKMKVTNDVDTIVTIKVKYAFDYNAKIEKRNTSNSIIIDDLTEEDYAEMYENIENNAILYSIFGQFMYTEDDYSEYEDQYLDDYNYEDEYIEDYEIDDEVIEPIF